MSPSEIARLLKGRRIGKGKWVCKCPAHKDRQPSCSVTDMGKGFTRVHCFAGCARADVLRSVGLTWRDLRPGPLAPAMRRRLTDAWKLEILTRKLGLVRCLQVVEKSKRDYWFAAERRLIAEMEPLYWKSLDLERFEKIREFEQRDYQNKRLDWLGRKHGGPMREEAMEGLERKAGR